MRKYQIIILIIVSVAMNIKGLAQTNSVTVSLDNETSQLLRSATEDSWFKKDVVVSTILGGILALAGGFGASLYSHKLELREKQREEVEFVKNLLRAIRCELEALGDLFDNGIGVHIRTINENDILKVRLSLTQDWFKVFNANACHLGRLEGDISKRIIVIYALMQAVIEELRVNNEYITRLEHVERELRQNLANENVIRQKSELFDFMRFQTNKIKMTDAELGSCVSEFYELLDKQDIR